MIGAYLKHEKPELSFKLVLRSWFEYAGNIYAVRSAPTDIFTLAVLAKAPWMRFHDEYGPILAQDTLDEYDRWYLLCGLVAADKPIALYESREMC